MRKSFLLQYIEFLEKNRETHCCNKLWKVMVEELKPIVLGKSDKYYFDEDDALDIIEFIQGEIPDSKTFDEWLDSVPEEFSGSNREKVRYIERKMGKFLGFIRQTEDPWSDLPLVLELFQKAIIEAIYGIKYKKSKKRRFTEVVIIIARKNGKTTLQVPLGIWTLFDNKGANVYIAATTYAQARILWKMAAEKFRSKSKVLKKLLGKRLNPQSELYYEDNDSHMFALTKNTKSQDGLKSKYNIIDEFHQLPYESYSLLKQATAATDQPITIMMGSAGTLRGALFDQKYETCSKIIEKQIVDDSILFICYELDDPEEMWDESKWTKANPALGAIKTYEYLREVVNKAKNSKTDLFETQVKDFNIIGVSNKAWLEAATINAGAYANYDVKLIDNKVELDNYLKKMDNTTVLAGFDLSKIGDTTAFITLLFDQEKKCIIIKPMFWITKAFLESTDCKRSEVPWLAWINAGYVRISSADDFINYKDITQYVLDEFAEHGYYYQFMNYDRWSATALVEDLHSNGWLKKSCLIPRAQFGQDISQAMEHFDIMLKEKKICYLNNPVFKWMLTNVEASIGKKEDLSPVKLGNNRAHKIDGPVATINALISYVKNPENYLESEE